MAFGSWLSEKGCGLSGKGRSDVREGWLPSLPHQRCRPSLCTVALSSRGAFLLLFIPNPPLQKKSFKYTYKLCVSKSNGWRRQWHPTPVLLPGKSHGQRSLVGCSPWGREESDKTERLHFHFSLSCIGEGNGNPFQCSCLENPRDGGAWWAAVYGVAQSRTRLKWLSRKS